MTAHSGEELSAMSAETSAMIKRACAWDEVDPAFDDAACERVLAGVESVVGPPPEGGGGGEPAAGAPRRLRRVAVVALVAAGLAGLGGGAMLARNAERVPPRPAPAATPPGRALPNAARWRPSSA